MEAILAVLVGIFFAVSAYLLMSKHLIRILLGAVVLSNAVNLLIFTAGRLTVRDVPPFIPLGSLTPEAATSNPLPQALVLTAIVIGFATTALFLVVLLAARGLTGTDHVDGREPER